MSGLKHARIVQYRRIATLLAISCMVNATLAETTRRASVSSAQVEGLLASSRASISASGRYIAFYSDADNLVPGDCKDEGGDCNGVRDVFVHDRDTATTVRISVSSSGKEGDGKSDRPSISADGRYVAFTSDASNLAGSDSNGQKDIFLHDRDTDGDGVFDDPGGIATTIISVANDGGESDGRNNLPAISADGRYVAFRSRATNLVTTSTSGVDHIFVRDRIGGVTTLVSRSTGGTEGDAASDRPAISPDGRYVAFHSDAANLVPGDEPTFNLGTCPLCTGVQDAFVHDRDPDGNGVFDEGNGATQRVSLSSDETAGNGPSSRPKPSDDGRYIVFKSAANNLVSDDTNASDDVFVRDRLLGTTVRVSVSSTGEQAVAAGPDSVRASVSTDGRHIAFASDADDLVPGDTNLATDIFVRDRTSGTTERVSVGAAGVQGNGLSNRPSISGDGRFVAFYSDAYNLIADDDPPFDTNLCPDCVGVRDIFIHDRTMSVTFRVSIATDGTPASAKCTRPSISADGLHVSFRSTADNLVAGDNNGLQDVFVRDIAGARTVRISLSSSQVETTDGNSDESAISGDGRFVAFWSKASNLVPGDDPPYDSILCPSCVGWADIFVRDRDPDNNGIFDENTSKTAAKHSTTIRVSVDSAGVAGNGDSFRPEISNDGRYVGFISEATNLVANDSNLKTDVFVYDRINDETTRVSVGAGGVQGNYGSDRVTLSADGRYVGFRSKADNLVAGDDPSYDADTCLTCPGWRDVFVRDRGPTNMKGNFVEANGTTTRVSLSSAGVAGNRETGGPKLSADASILAMVGPASNLVASDTNRAEDVFVRDLVTNTTERVSVSSSETQASTPDQFPADSDDATISADGRFVAFRSFAINFASRDINLAADIFLYDRDADDDGLFDEPGAIDTIRLSVDDSGVEANKASGGAKISADRSTIAFYSDATNLVPGDNNLVRDVFYRSLFVCGDGVVDSGEQCDDGTNNSDTTPNACRTDCSDPTCGDGVVDTGEPCDDGVSNSDTTPNACRTDCSDPTCGDGVVDSGELCDDGANNSDTTPNACRTDCSDPTCGDGVVDSGEQCDGADDATCPGLCFPPGDPTTECTCGCVSGSCDDGNGCTFNDTCNESGLCVGTDVNSLAIACVTDADCQAATGLTAPICVGGFCECFQAPDPPVLGLNAHGRTLEILFPALGGGSASSVAAATAFRVTLVSLYNPADPQPVDQPDYSLSDGQVRYLNLLRDGDGNVVTECVSSSAWGFTYPCASVGCTPEFVDWAGLFAGKTLYVSGNAIIPDSTYTMSQLAASCEGNEDTCIDASGEVPFATTRYGDTEPSGSVNVTDVVNTVDVVKQLFVSLWEYQVYVRNPNPAPHLDATNVTDIVLHVDALKLVSYVLPLNPCP